MEIEPFTSYVITLVQYISSFYIRNFKPLASFCGCPSRFESYLVESPEHRFSHDEAHMGLNKTKRGKSSTAVDHLTI